MQTTETSSKQSSTDLATMSGTIMLSCWVIGTPVGKQTFIVRVRHDGVWHDVKKAIKEEKKVDFNDIDADTFDLWKVRRCAISHVVAQLLIQKVTIGRSQRSLLESKDYLNSVLATNLLEPIDPVSKEFNDQLPDDRINIIIVQRPTCELFENELITSLLTAHVFLFRVLLLNVALFPRPSANFFPLTFPSPYCPKWRSLLDPFHLLSQPQ
jgi:hypothetical protein